MKISIKFRFNWLIVFVEVKYDQVIDMDVGWRVITISNVTHLGKVN
jgi:hypothetical protein